jgi:thioredoxin reductase
MSAGLNGHVLVVGGGLAGATAAVECVNRGLRVTLVDEHALPISIMSMDVPYLFGSRLAAALGDRHLMMERVLGGNEPLQEAWNAGADVLLGTSAWGVFRPGPTSRHLQNSCVGLSDFERSWTVDYECLLLATGSRDLVLSFPGSTLPGVVGANAVHVLISRYQALSAKRMIVLGSGNLGLQTAALALDHGIEVPAIVEVASDVIGAPELKAQLEARGVAFYCRHTVSEVFGDADVRGIRLVHATDDGLPIDGTETDIPCDSVCMAFGKVPSIELAALAGCELQFDELRGGWIPTRNGDGETSVGGIYAVGDVAGISELSVLDSRAAVEEAKAAAIAISERISLDKCSLSPRVAKKVEFPQAGGKSVAARWQESLVAAGGMDVVACHCETVTRRHLLDISPPGYVKLPKHQNAQTVSESGTYNPDILKRLTRAGMGHCQGRRCREQVAMLLAKATAKDLADIPLASYRAPIRPLPVSSLAATEEPEELSKNWAAWFRPLKVDK